MNVPKINNRIETPITIPTNLATNFHHVVTSIRPNANAPITIPEVGDSKFSTPFADWKAVITNDWDTFTNSPKGAKIPIVAPAKPEEEGIKNDNGK